MTDVVELEAPAPSGVEVGARPRRQVAGAPARDQLVVVGGQLAAGLGNFAFALAAVRILSPSDFTALAAFLVAYLLLHLPAAAFGAGTARSPSLARAARRRALVVAGVATAGLVVTAPFLASTLRVSSTLPLLLAAATPTAALLAIERGRCYATSAHGVLVTSFVAEPAVRLTLGLLLAAALGATGAALGVVLAGYAALAVACRSPRRAGPDTIHDDARSPAPVIVGFLLLALLQNQDLLVATRMLAPGQAARFAALSTLGGMAAFATATVPMVLLPRVAHRRAFRVALLLAAVIGAAATLVVFAGAHPIVDLAFGESYSSIATLAAPYVLAMALLGVLRVLVADAATSPHPRIVLAILVGAVALHLTLLVTTATSARSVAVATLVTMVAAVAATAGLVVTRAHPDVIARTWVRARTAGLVPIAAITTGALALRLAVTRGIWVDEAISISSAGKPFGQMLHQLQTTDVQPPLHSALLWLTIRIAGSGELAIRSSSMVAGTLVVPVLCLLGREIYDRRTGIVAALVGAVSPLAIWYSQEGRMYALYMLFAVVALYAQVRALRDGRARWWVLYATATAALLWTQYLSVLFIAAQQVVFVHALWCARRSEESIRRRLASWLAALLLVAVLLAPLLPYLGNQLAAYAHRGAGLSSVPAQAGSATSQQPLLSVYSIIANLLWALTGYHADRTMELLAALWPFGIVVALALLGRRLAVWTRRLLLLVAVPMGLLFLLGLRRPDLFELRYVAAVVPMLSLLLGRAITAMVSRPRLVRVAATALVALLLVSLADQQFNGANPRLYDFRGAVSEVAGKARPGDHVLYNPVYLESVVRYYGPALHLAPVDDWRAVVHARGRIFVIGSFFDKRDISARTGAVLARLERERTLVDTFRRPQIRVWVFQ